MTVLQDVAHPGKDGCEIRSGKEAMREVYGTS